MTTAEFGPNTASGERTADLAQRRRALLQSRLAERKLATSGPAAAPPREPDARLPLSPGQQRMWFVQQLDPAGTALNICVGFTLTGALDAARLRRAVAAVTDRHDLLRTTYHADGDGLPYQRVHLNAEPSWTEHDLSALPEQDRALRIEVLARREFTRPFDLAADLPLRITLVRTAADEHVLLLVAHHIAWDDDSWEVFFGDLTAAYRADDHSGDVAAARASAVHYLDVEVLARRSNEQAGQGEQADLDYWSQTLAAPPEPLELPGESGPPTVGAGVAQRAVLRLPAATLDRVGALGRDTGATPFMVLLAAFDAVVHRYTGADDFFVATPVVNRRGDSQRALGYFGNTVVLRSRPGSGSTFRELVADTRDVCAGAFAHQRAGLDRIVRELSPDRSAGIEAMARLSFGARSGTGPGFAPDGITCTRADLHSPVAQVPLGVMAEFSSDGVVLELEYLSEVLDERIARQFLHHLAQFLDAALADPGQRVAQIDLLGDEDRAELVALATGTRADHAAVTLASLVETQVARTPDAAALVLDDETISYAELDLRANRLAHWLIGRGIGPEDLVGLSFPRSAEMVIAALAVLKSGAAYLPIDPTYPQDRIDYMIADAQPKMLLTGADGLEAAVRDCASHAPTDADRVRPLRLSNLAYVIYTSGSTGNPKGVPVDHAAIVEYLEWIQREYAVGADDALLQVASTSFDVSVGEMFGPLIGGARLVIPKPDGLQDLPYLTQLLHDQQITSMHFVPSLLGLFMMLPGAAEWKSLRRVPIGGEALPGELADKFRNTYDAQLHNFYGPTEATLAATRYKVESPQGVRIVPIGSPKANTEVYLLDSSLELVPRGVIGEVYIGGTQLARGYLGRPALTAERFVADPFTPGGRLYRTGDVARWNADGDIEFIGRADEQVKIRGFRIELGEIEAAVAAHEQVGHAVVVVHESAALGKSLVAYVVPSDAVSGADVESVRAQVTAGLPEYMVPSAFVVIEEIPLTPNGKLDKRALPEPDLSVRVSSRDPETATEVAVCTAFAEALGLPRVGAEDSFFDLGGHSLLATRLMSRLRAEFGVEVSIREAFDAPTAAGIAALIDAKREQAAESGRPLLVAATERPAEIPLSYAQLRQWFLYRLEGANPTYNIPFAARIEGPLDLPALTAALSDVVARHESLRTTYPERDGMPHQLVHAPAPVDVAVTDLPTVDDPEAQVQAVLAQERGYCFELAEELPIRVRVFRRGDHEHVLSVLIHHIAGDEWSAPVLFGDLVAAYAARVNGAAPQWPELPIQYVDYALWQRELLGLSVPGSTPDHDNATTEIPDSVGARQVHYWRDKLAGLPEDTTVLRDRPRPAVAGSDGDTVHFTVPAPVRRGLADLGREAGASDFMVLQTAVAVLLSKLGAGQDIPLGTPIAGRTEHALSELVGFFVNTLVVRNDLTGDPTLHTVLRRARETALEGYANQDLPFERLVDALGPDRSLSRHPVFQVLVQLRESGELSQLLPGRAGSDEEVRLTAIPPEFDTAKFDLSFDFYEDESGSEGARFGGGINYRTELYDRSTVESLVERLQRVLAAFAQAPDTALGELDILGADERRAVLSGWSRGPEQVAGTPATVPALLAAGRATTPADAVAIRWHDEELSYGDLHERSDRLAAQLRSRGAGPDRFVGIAMPRTPDMVVALVAVMKSGAAFLPLDLRYPAERLALMIEGATPVCVLTTASAEAALPEVEGVPRLLVDDETSFAATGVGATTGTPGGDNAAYFLYTSGSTGVPKGVVGTQEAMANRLAWQPAMFPVEAPGGGDVRLAQGSLSFLDGGLELLAAVAAGATMILADDDQARDLEQLAKLVDRHPVGQVTAVASAVSALADSAPEVTATVPRWVCSGEPLTESLLDRLGAAAPESEIVNSYGATETAGAIVRGGVAPGALKVGKPVPGTRILLLDDSLAPVPQGVIGEIYVAGAQLARGYWSKPGLTAARFVANPYAQRPGERLYRTGDRARWNTDGELEFAGRTDHQVKVRGFRIELGEVETALRGAPGVAVGAARTVDVAGVSNLAGYVVPTATVRENGFDESAFLVGVRAYLSATLPGYMMPSSLTALEAMPLTGSGKLDRLSLPAPALATSGGSEPPATETEKVLAGLFEEVLGARDVGRSDGFFSLGGDSIVSIQLAGKARTAGLTLTPQMIFENPTLAELAAACDQHAPQAEPEAPPEPSAPMSASGLGQDALAALKASWGARG